MLRPEVVAACIDDLWSRDIHAHFGAYLHLRQQAGRLGSMSGIQPDWNALKQYLAVPGGPPRRPFLRPFWKGKKTSNQEWLNDNLAGSYAPSSLRQRLRMIVEVDDSGRYTLREGHDALALEHLLYGQPLSVIALASFLFRDYAFITAGSIEPVELAAVFRTEFGYRSPNDDTEFASLYSLDVPSIDEDWFEPWPLKN